ncbi:MAG: calcium-binding protein, partial [bacterium]
NHTAHLNAREYDAESHEKAVNNILIGEGGADRLEGGQGDDILVGGEGFDTYVYRPGDGEDTIVDADGQGAIEIERDGVRQRVLLGVHHPHDPEGTYGSPHTGVSYSWSGQAGDDLKIQVAGSGTLTLKSYQPGALGIKLVSAAPLPSPKETLTGTPGDDFDDVTPGPYLGHSNISGGQVDFNVAEDGSILPQGKSLRAPYRVGGVTEGWDIEAIHGLEGDDNITGGPSTRLLDGGAGNDWIKADWVSLSVPADPEVNGMVLLGGEGNDEIWASRRSALDDWIVAGPDTLPAGSDHDQVFGHGGADVIFGGVGNDWLAGGNGARLEWLLAYPRPDGDDILIGGPDESAVPDHDHLLGGAGSDYLYGGAGNDVLYGDADGGLNRTTWWVGSDEDGRDEYVFGWSGELGQHPIPLLPYSNSSPDDPSHNTLVMRYELPAQHPEGATLEAGRDTLYGGKGQDELFGGAQEDLLEGGADDDKLYGEGGNDTLYGGDGADELWGDKSVEVYHEDMRLREGGSLAEGTAYRYLYRLHRDGPDVAGDDLLDGGSGDDILRGGGGA